MATGNYERCGGGGPMIRVAGFGANETANAPRTPVPTRAYEDPSTWGSAVSSTVTSIADLARAVRGEPRVTDEAPMDYSVPTGEGESFFSTTGGKVLIFGGLGLAVLGLVFFLRKKTNKRRANRRRRNPCGRGRVPNGRPAWQSIPTLRGFRRTMTGWAWTASSRSRAAGLRVGIYQEGSRYKAAVSSNQGSTSLGPFTTPDAAVEATRRWVAGHVG